MNQSIRYSSVQVTKASMAALLLAATLLVLFVMPAEYDIDVTGIGKALGLTDLAQEQQVDSFQIQNTDIAFDSKSFALAPFESLEYKYSMRTGASMVYQWHASAEVISDFHAENPDDESQVEKSYRQQRDQGTQARYSAEFDGIHGWFFENRNLQEITIQLSSAGFYSHAQEFRDGKRIDHPITKR